MDQPIDENTRAMRMLLRAAHNAARASGSQAVTDQRRQAYLAEAIGWASR